LSLWRAARNRDRQAIKNPRKGAGFKKISCDSLDSGNVGSRRAFGTVSDFKLYTLAFGKGFETVADNGGEMNENVFAAIFRGDETEAFGFIKPLNATFNLGHQTYL